MLDIIQIEVLVLLITVIIAVFHHDRQSWTLRRYRYFNLCLYATILNVLADISATLALQYPGRASNVLCYVLKCACFMMQYANFTLMIGFVLFLVYERAAGQRRYRRLERGIFAVLAAMEALVLTNFGTGWLFTIEDGVIRYGALYYMGTMVLTAEIAMVCVAYRSSHTVASRSMRRIMWALPPIVLLMLWMRRITGGMITAGMIACISNLALFISFQSTRIGQDAVTELPNRHMFIEELDRKRRRVHEARSTSGTHLVLIILDESFDAANRTLGLQMGDSLLFMIARYLDEYRPRYQAYRLGGTHFMLMGSYEGEQESRRTVQRLQARFLEEWVAGGVRLNLNANIAHMMLTPREADDPRLIEQLEYMLAHANDGGLIFFDDELKKKYERKYYVIDQMRGALETERFEIYYQPIYSCADGGFHTAESLVRMQDERGEFISPGEFIPLAERSGMIDAITWIVFKKVCRFLGENPQLPVNAVSVNMSIEQLTDKGFLQRIRSICRQFGVDPSHLRIEITERVITENPALVHSVMEQLEADGLHFYLDDFGVGYSNLASMMKLPFETVKMDISLMRGIDVSDKAYTTMSLLMQMLHNAGFIVVTEGIETAQTAMKVKQAGADRIQGFYYSRPMPQEAYRRFMQERMRTGEAQ